jgi:L-threonylcarbamoyladenylate synthase
MKYYSRALLKKIKRHLKDGGIIAYPTEYCFGLGCDPFNRQAINKLIRLKQRNQNKGLIIIAGKIWQLDKLIKPLSLMEQEQVKQYWPGAYSIIVSSSKSAPKKLAGKFTKIAVRVTSHKLVIELCNYLGYPLVSTSANKSGLYPAKTYRNCYKMFGKSVMVLPGNTSFAKSPSSIIDLNTGKTYR